MPMTTKLGRMMTYLDEILPIKSNDPLITWSCEITWQSKTIIPTLPQFLCSPDDDIPWEAPNHKVIQSFDHVVFQVHVTNKNPYISTTRVPLAIKLGKMMIYLDGLLYKVSWPFDHVVLKDYVTNESQYITTIRAPISTKSDRIVTYLYGGLLIYSPNHLIWSC